MKSPSFFEFQTIIQYLQDELESCQLQEVQSNEDGLVLGFYRFTREPKSVWLVIDLDQQFPFIGLFPDNPWPKIKKTKPLALFLSSHFKNTRLKKIELLENFGRVAEFDFSLPDKQLKLELRLIPKQPNLRAKITEKSRDKVVSWDKPRDIISVENKSQTSGFEEDHRSVHFIFKQWLERRGQNQKNSKNTEQASGATSPYDKWLNQKRKDLQKKQKALQQIELQNQEHLKTPWVDIGQYLKTYGLKNFPLEWTPFVELDKKVSFNIERCFEKSKQVIQKIAGSEKRKIILLEEIEKLNDLSEQVFQDDLSVLLAKQNKQGQRKSTEAAFRKLSLDPEGQITVLMGKSAAENLKILRQAKGWDLWLHLKDYPSAYAIIQKNKDKKISDELIYKAGQWLVKESLKNKKNLTGVKMAVVIAECRHVKPIKGDKIGRVTYHYPRGLLITV